MSPLARRFWLLALAQACHSIEEMRTALYDFFWVATGRFHEWVPAIPQRRMTARTFAALNTGIIALLLAAVPFVSARRQWALALAAAAAVVEIANGAGHLAGTVVFSGYVPGALTAPLLIAAGIAVLAALRRRKEAPATANLPLSGVDRSPEFFESSRAWRRSCSSASRARASRASIGSASSIRTSA